MSILHKAKAIALDFKAALTGAQRWPVEMTTDFLHETVEAGHGRDNPQLSLQYRAFHVGGGRYKIVEYSNIVYFVDGVSGMGTERETIWATESGQSEFSHAETHALLGTLEAARVRECGAVRSSPQACHNHHSRFALGLTTAPGLALR